MLAKKAGYMSGITDNFIFPPGCHKMLFMNNWLENARRQIEQSEALIQMGEQLITSSVAALFRDWQSPSMVIDKLCTGAERWQAAIRQMQAPINLADILRSRPSE